MENKNKRRNIFLVFLFSTILGCLICLTVLKELPIFIPETSLLSDEINAHLQVLKDDIYYAESDNGKLNKIKFEISKIISDTTIESAIQELDLNFTKEDINKESIDTFLLLKIRPLNQSYSSIIDGSNFQCYNFLSSYENKNDDYYSPFYSKVKEKLCKEISSLNRYFYTTVNESLSEKQKIETFKKKYNHDNIKSVLTNFESRLLTISNEIQSKIDDGEKNIEKYRNRIKYTKESIAKLSEKGLSRLLILYAVPIFGLLLVIIMIIPTFYESVDIKKTIFDSGLLLQLITVFLLTAIILLLGIGNKIDSQVLGTLLGGISVYVLQQSSSAIKKKNTK